MQKLKLLIVIDNLKKGGAEVLLSGVLPELNDHFYVILATLSDECDFDEEEVLCKKKYSLCFKNKYSLFTCVSRLKKIIEKERPSFIHSHLFYSSVIARMACPDSVPLFYSLHNEMSKNVFNGSKVLTLLEKKTVKQNHFAIAVSEHVLKDYQTIIGKQETAFVLPNYISDQFFDTEKIENKIDGKKELKLVAVGNIKKQKNYSYLLNAFENLKNIPVTLDIYGAGSRKEEEMLQKEIDKNKLPVYLQGKANNVDEILTGYDLFVSSSAYEGFGISVIEAMAMGLPLLLSDLPVFHEVTLDNALFFQLSNPLSFSNLIINILEKKINLSHFSNKGIEISKRYSKEIYLENLFSIYGTVLKKPIINFSLANA
jgi:glycosyltransferase involved in cell wall biosynthesis